MAHDPAYPFEVGVDGIDGSRFHFTQCGSIDAGTAITLRYGMTDSHDLQDWLDRAVAGRVERRNVSIVRLDTDGTPTSERYELIDAWPQSWEGAMVDGSSEPMALARLTLQFAGVADR